MDYVKFQVINPDVKKIYNSDKLEFIGSHNTATGEIYDDKIIAEIHYCKLIIYKSGSVYFSGSIHKMYNSINNIKAPNFKNESKGTYKGFNGNQFGTKEIKFIVDYLEKLLYTKAISMKIKCIELGLNLVIDFCPQKFILGLLYFKGIPFDFKFKRKYAQVNLMDFRIKIYNKSSQYGMSEHVIRIEVNFSRMKVLNEIGMVCMCDLKEEQIFKGLEVVLKKLKNTIYFDDTIRRAELTKQQIRNLIKYKCNRYWLDDLKPNKRHKPKLKLDYLIANHSSNLKKKIIDVFLKTRVINTQDLKPKTRVINTRSIIGVNITQSTDKRCPITGISLEHEKPDAKYIRTSTLKYLLENEKRTYLDLCSLLLNTLHLDHPKYESNIIKHLAKQVRNRFYNPNQIRKVGYKQRQYKYQLSLTF